MDGTKSKRDDSADLSARTIRCGTEPSVPRAQGMWVLNIHPVEPQSSHEGPSTAGTSSRQLADVYRSSYDSMKNAKVESWDGEWPVICLQSCPCAGDISYVPTKGPSVRYIIRPGYGSVCTLTLNRRNAKPAKSLENLHPSLLSALEHDSLKRVCPCTIRGAGVSDALPGLQISWIRDPHDGSTHLVRFVDKLAEDFDKLCAESSADQSDLSPTKMPWVTNVARLIFTERFPIKTGESSSSAVVEHKIALDVEFAQDDPSVRSE